MNPLLKELKSHGFKIRYTQPRGEPRDYYVNDSDLEDYIKSGRDGFLTTEENLTNGHTVVMYQNPLLATIEGMGLSRSEALIKLVLKLLE